MITTEQALEALRKVMDPDIGRDIVDLGMVRDLQVQDDGTVRFTLALTIPTCPLKDQMAFNAEQILKSQPGVKQVFIQFDVLGDAQRQAIIGAASSGLPKLNTFNRVQRVVAVMSGKGGVGKSSLTALLAVELARQGKKVGILDADVTGPSIPRLFNLPPGGLRGGSQGILPAITPLGIKVVSTNVLVPEEDAPVLWRGPLIAGTIQQFWNDVLWGKLDFLLVDLPPGTADAALTVIRTLPLNGVVMVTSPQGLVAMVVRKAVRMLQTLEIPVLGLVENFSYFLCPDCGSQHEVFGPSHAAEIAEMAHTGVLVRLPFDPQFSARCDAGQVEQVHSPLLAPVIERLNQLEVVQTGQV